MIQSENPVSLCNNMHKCGAFSLKPTPRELDRLKTTSHLLIRQQSKGKLIQIILASKTTSK
jgi:hypothetical protein